ncbi:MAG: amino acid ABC transporter permease [Anaerolineae bacterium]|nr:amino acid ABC transporter permease [Anaerolineae bacterium]
MDEDRTRYPGRDELPFKVSRDSFGTQLAQFPWWLLGIFLVAIWAGVIILTQEKYNEAFNFIIVGVRYTIITSLTAFGIATVIGLMTGIARLSQNVFFRNLAIFYIEIIRGIPMLVLIFFLALVGVPFVVDSINAFGVDLVEKGYSFIGELFVKFDNKNISMNARAVTALSVTYGAFLAEVFRAGIQSIGRGQAEAARSLGMSAPQAMRYIILPQAVRNILPALGNDFVAMVKDSSLISVLAVRDITQLAKLYSGRTFRYREAFVTLSVIYLTMTVTLSLFAQQFERWLRKDD